MPSVSDMIPVALPTPHQRKVLRETAGLTIRQLATVVGCSHSAIARWEAGDRTPKGDRRKAYAAALAELAALEETP